MNESSSPMDQLPSRSWLTLPNLLCAIRLIGSPVLLALAIAGRPSAFLLLFIVLMLTDWMDGKLAILSNELDLFYGAEFREKLPFLRHFDLIIDATYTQILKPDPRAYLMVCEGLNLEPENCVFVDDQMRNIRGGEEVGMQCVHFDVLQPDSSYDRALQLMGIAGH